MHYRVRDVGPVYDEMEGFMTMAKVSYISNQPRGDAVLDAQGLRRERLSIGRWCCVGSIEGPYTTGSGRDGCSSN